MKKWIFSLCLLFSIFSSATYSEQMIDHEHIRPIRAFKVGEKGYAETYAINAGTLSVRAMEIQGFSGESLAKMQKAFVVLEKVVNTEEFKERVINFKNTLGQRAFASNNGMSNEEIYAFFMDGRETLQQNTPGEMNFYLKLYNRPWSKVIGWTNGDINTIHINWKFFKNFRLSDVAGNLAHEWTHKLGFGHKSAKEHDSAPYAIGYIVREMGERYLKGEELY